MKWIVLLVLSWAAWMMWRKPRKPSGVAVDPRLLRDAAEARAILGVAAGADPDAIRAAHRRLLATAHPDRGGSTELAGRANAARDLLLRLAE